MLYVKESVPNKLSMVFDKRVIKEEPKGTIHKDIRNVIGIIITNAISTQTSPASSYRRKSMQVLLSVFLHGVEDTQDVQEEVDYVQVEVDGSQNVLLGWQLAHQNVGVVDDEAAEEQSASAGTHQLHCIVVEENLSYNRKMQLETKSVGGKKSELDYSVKMCADIQYDCVSFIERWEISTHPHKASNDENPKTCKQPNK